MKVLLVIDHFGMGGAQRQMVELACGLARRGYVVECFIYFPQHDFFRPQLEAQHIVIHECRKGRGFSFGVVRRLAVLVRGGGFDCVISYLNSANIYAELSTFLYGKTPLIVSERTSHHDDRFAAGALARRMMHGLADRVVANSYSHCAWLKQKWWLKDKVSCIYNGLNLASFRTGGPVPASIDELRLVAIGRVGPEKNILNLILALGLLYAERDCAPQVSWVGDRDTSPAGLRYCCQIDELLQSMPEIRRRWHWGGVETDIPALLSRHHALVHPSLYEGLPNVVCEALAAGMPVLISNVCDHPLLVADGERGFLFDPATPASAAGAIRKLMDLNADGWRGFSCNARAYAESHLGIERMIASYEALISEVIGVGRTATCSL